MQTCPCHTDGHKWSPSGVVEVWVLVGFFPPQTQQGPDCVRSCGAPWLTAGATALAHPWCQGMVQFPSRSRLLSFGAEPAPLWEAGMLSRPGGRIVAPRCVPWHKHRPPPRRVSAGGRAGPGRDGAASPLAGRWPEPTARLLPGSGIGGCAASGTRSASPRWRFGGTVLAPQVAE